MSFMDATGRWSWRQVLLLLAVVLGVVIMHAPLAGSDVPAADEPVSVGPMSTTDQEPPGVVDHAAAAVMTAGSAFASLVDGDVGGTHDMAAGDHDSMPAGALHDLMHLCLAVLAGLVVLGLAGFLAFLLYEPARSAAAVRSAPVIVPPGPPPRMAVRLAHLCVLRN
jgi:hypothetical protein